MHTVIGKDAKVGGWTRVEGTPNDPNPNKPYTKMDNTPLFNQEGKLNPSITIVGKQQTSIEPSEKKPDHLCLQAATFAFLPRLFC